MSGYLLKMISLFYSIQNFSEKNCEFRFSHVFCELYFTGEQSRSCLVIHTLRESIQYLVWLSTIFAMVNQIQFVNFKFFRQRSSK
jgi:hypothetical protein